MLSPSGWWLAVAPVDLRCGMDRLMVAVQAALGRDAFDGGAYVLTSFAVVKRLVTGPARGSRCCAVTRKGYGCVCGGCRRAISCGRAAAMPRASFRAKRWPGCVRGSTGDD